MHQPLLLGTSSSEVMRQLPASEIKGLGALCPGGWPSEEVWPIGRAQWSSGRGSQKKKCNHAPVASISSPVNASSVSQADQTSDSTSG